MSSTPPVKWKKLLSWYAERGRRLPWRGTTDDYRLTVSEFMLQQTQVSRVIPLYRRFLRFFPSWRSLAAAPQSEVVRAWKGLGYNLRAVRLRELARTIVEDHGGRLPDDERTLLGLKGIGPYTARALRAFIHRQPVLAPDTNVRRALSRLFLGPTADPRIWNFDRWRRWERTVPAGSAHDLNQALMDLGASVCKAGKPDCPSCPLSGECKSYPKILTMPRQSLPRQKAPTGERLDEFGVPNRIYRGRIIERLRAGAVPTKRLDELGRRVRGRYGRKDRTWLRGVLAGLERDGLIERRRGFIRLA